MKKIISTLPLLVLCACKTQGVFYPYEGNKTIAGEGGFIETVVPVNQIGTHIFAKKADYKYDSVAFYKSGLPSGENCKLIGYYADTNMNQIAKFMLNSNANTATKSSVFFPIKFDNDAGFLDGTGNASDWYSLYNGSMVQTAKGYNIFECK